MPKVFNEPPETQTPFGRVLTEFMWGQRPPWTNAKTARAIGTSKTNVTKWTTTDRAPLMDTQLRVLAALNIPLARLVEAYREDGVPIPPLTDAQPEPPRERPYTPPAPPLSEEERWDLMRAQTRRAMTEAGLGEHAIAAVLEHLQRQRDGTDPWRDRIAAEHAPEPSPAPAAGDERGDARRTGPGTPSPRTLPESIGQG